MMRNDAVALIHVCPGIRIHIIDIVHPPGIGISPMAIMVITPLMLFVLVVAAPPGGFFVTPFGSAVEPLVHAPESVQSARIGGIGVIDDAVLERERAHARPLANVCGHVCS